MVLATISPELRPRPLPRSYAPFHQLLRGPAFRWWRPLVCLALVVGMYGAAFVVVTVVGIALAGLTGSLEPELDISSPGAFFFSNLLIIVALPASVLSIWVAHRIRPGFATSVLGRLRWRWLGRCLLVLAPLWVAYLGIGVVISLVTGEEVSAPPQQWLLLLLLMLITTPFQAAAEEYLFRGWLAQNLGAYFTSEKIGLVVGGVVSSILFALAHGSFDPWIVADLLAFAVAATILTWRTGGLEAAIALHVINNVLIFVLTLSLGGWDEAFIDDTSAGSPLAFALSLVAQILAVVLVLRLAKRHQVAPRSVTTG